MVLKVIFWFVGWLDWELMWMGSKLLLGKIFFIFKMIFLIFFLYLGIFVFWDNVMNLICLVLSFVNSFVFLVYCGLVVFLVVSLMLLSGMLVFVF